jgi:hypothetical protein
LFFSAFLLKQLNSPQNRLDDASATPPVVFDGWSLVSALNDKSGL